MKPLLFDVKPLLKDSIYVKEIDVPHLDDQFHFHNAYEIAYIIKSNGTRIVGDSIENFTDGDLVLMGPQIPHMVYYRLNNNSLKIHALVIYFHPNWLTEDQLNSTNLTKLRKLFDNLKRGIKIFGNTRKKVVQNIIKLKQCSGLESIITLLTILEIISTSKEYECLASEGYSNSFNQKDITRLDNVYQYVRDNFTDTIKLDEIAAIANMTPTAFCKYFKNKTQKTFANFVNEVRIGYACKLLCNENLTVSEVCFKCGFNNLTNFNRNFKHFTRMIPSKYKTIHTAR